MTDELITTEREGQIAKLVAQRRKGLSNPECDYADKIDDNGHAIKEVSVKTGPDNWATYDVDMTKMLRAAPSTTADVDLLVLSAKIAAERGAQPNPHVPSSVETLEKLLTRLEGTDLQPAWEVSDDE